MLRKINQTNKNLLLVIQNYGCLFLCFAHASPLIFEGKQGCLALNKIWQEAEKKNYISKDLNEDGDYEDNGEAEVKNHNALANEFFALDVRYDNIHHKADEKIPSSVKIVFGKYKYTGCHFVQLDKNKKVIFDSFDKSITVQKGKLHTMRWYYAN